MYLQKQNLSASEHCLTRDGEVYNALQHGSTMHNGVIECTLS